jgi:hypothetical protein
MTCVRFGNAIVMLAPPPVEFKHKGHWIRFEFDPRFGPAMLNENGRVVDWNDRYEAGYPKWWWDGFEFWWMNKQRTA